MNYQLFSNASATTTKKPLKLKKVKRKALPREERILPYQPKQERNSKVSQR